MSPEEEKRYRELISAEVDAEVWSLGCGVYGPFIRAMHAAAQEAREKAIKEAAKVSNG